MTEQEFEKEVNGLIEQYLGELKTKFKAYNDSLTEGDVEKKTATSKSPKAKKTTKKTTKK